MWHKMLKLEHEFLAATSLHASAMRKPVHTGIECRGLAGMDRLPAGTTGGIGKARGRLKR